MSATPEHYVFFLNPVSLRMLPLLLGSKGPAQCIQWRGQPPEILCIRRPEPAFCGECCLRSCQEVARDRCSSDARRRRAAEGFWSDSVEDLNAALASGRCLERGEAKKCTAPPHCELNCLQLSPSPTASWFGDICSARRPLRSLLLADATDQRGSTRECSSSVAGSCTALIEPAFVFHQANAFCSADGRVVVDCVRYPKMPTFDQVRRENLKWTPTTCSESVGTGRARNIRFSVTSLEC